MSKIHNTAIIHPSAQIADDVEIGAFAVIGENVKIDKGVIIRPYAHVEFAEIGENSMIYSGAIIGTEPQDLGYKNEPTKVVIGKRVQVREYVTINRASGEGGVTQVGDECL